MKQIFFDTETTGLDAKNGHRIIEIACIEMMDRQRTGRSLHFYFNPERPIDQQAFEVHGLSDDFLADKPKFADKVQEFLAFIQGAELIAHNASFDVGFLDAELGRLSMQPFQSYVYGVVDTLQMARNLFPGQRNSLDALCNRLGVNNSHRTLHGALLDSEILAEVYLAMTRGQESLGIEFGELGEQDKKNTINLVNLSLPLFCMSVTDEQAHWAYLEQMDKELKKPCIWREFCYDIQ
jgi:DNA polymerase III subunit epsilon